MPFGACLAVGKKKLLQLTDQLSILAVRGGDYAEFRGQLEGVKHLFVIDAEEVLIGEKDFEGCGSVVNDFAELSLGLAVVARDGHMECVVAGAVAFGFLFPSVVAFERIFVPGGAAHLNERGGAADERGFAGCGVGVLCKCGHEGEMNVDVGIDESGEDEFARGIDDFCVWRHVEMDADAADGFVFDEDVGVRPSIRGDDFSAFDQQSHRSFSPRLQASSNSTNASMNMNADPFAIGFHRLPVFGDFGLILRELAPCNSTAA